MGQLGRSKDGRRLFCNDGVALVELESRLPVLQDADLNGKIVLIRVDHNVVKGNKIKDAYRIDQSLATLYNVVEHGGRPIIMTHVGRPFHKDSGRIAADESTSVAPIVSYLQNKLGISIGVPKFVADAERGIQSIDTTIMSMIRDLRARKLGAIYLPNTRWFEGEEGKFGEDARERLAAMLAGIADVFVNDAFGSWQPHVTTCDITRHLPSYAGLLMQKEIAHLSMISSPRRPFLAVIAGSKYDTKIGTLNVICEDVDALILGGVLYNAYLCAKYGVRIRGVAEEEVEAARALLKYAPKIMELPIIVESDSVRKVEGQWRRREVTDLKAGDELGYVVDVGAGAFSSPAIATAIAGAGTIFVNAVMGITENGFREGTRALDEAVGGNMAARKLFGGGDTLHEFKSIAPGLYLAALEDVSYYLFTGGGTVLTAIQKGSAYGLPTVQALMENADRAGYQPRTVSCECDTLPGEEEGGEGGGGEGGGGDAPTSAKCGSGGCC